MILFDFTCLGCEFTQEYLVDRDIEAMECPQCHGVMKKSFLRAGGHRLPDDTPWLKTVLEVVEKNPGADKPHTRAFLKNPTRENYHNWMRENGIRPLENGEEGRKVTEKDRKENRHRMAGRLARNLMDRRSISVRTR